MQNKKDSYARRGIREVGTNHESDYKVIFLHNIQVVYFNITMNHTITFLLK